ncbi:MAG TPA: VWA domain-containing protein [Chloroflexia bacterium]|nr:VWA domain-containing protein [Chloroflexia bacterium]
MNTPAPRPGPFLEHLRAEDTPFTLRRSGAPVWADEAAHRAFYQGDPELYALAALVTGTPESQRLRILYQVLERSRTDLAAGERATLGRVTRLLLAVLPADQVLTVFLALRRARANHKHTAHAILGYILNHPQMEDLVRRRRPTVMDCLEHALGKNVARGAIRRLIETPDDRAYVQRTMLRFAHDPERGQAILPALYQRPATTMLARGDAAGGYPQTHAPYRDYLDRPLERPKTVTPTNRGDIAATLVHLYRGGPSAELEAALEPYVVAAAARLPRFPARIGLVLDASASTRSYGEREFCCLAQSVALARILARNTAHLTIYPVGGRGALPPPEGPTDLAAPVLAALADDPDVVAIVSDGYENFYQGDLARVVATLPQAGVRIPVVFCHSKFTPLDDVSLRRPAPTLPELAFWHENDFEEVLIRLFTLARGPQGAASMREFLRNRLDQLEKEVQPWTITA